MKHKIKINGKDKDQGKNKIYEIHGYMNKMNSDEHYLF